MHRWCFQIAFSSSICQATSKTSGLVERDRSQTTGSGEGKSRSPRPLCTIPRRPAAPGGFTEADGLSGGGLSPRTDCWLSAVRARP